VAHLRRISFTRPIPPSAEIIEKDGKRFARFRTGRGKLMNAPVTADGNSIRLRSRKWYGDYRNAAGLRERVPLATDRTAAEQMLAALVKRAERAKVPDLQDPFEQHHSRPLAEHLEDYRRYLLAEGNCQQYVAKTCAQIRTILDGCGLRFIRDLASEKVTEFLHQLRRTPARAELPPGKEWFAPREMVQALGGSRPTRLARFLRRERLAVDGNGKARRYPRSTVQALQDRFCRGMSISTSNGYLTAIKSFSRWLATKDRTDRDRLLSLSRLNAKTDPRHERRALPAGELRAILEVAGRSPLTCQGLAGPDRLMLYATAMVTGFRASELASLVPRSFDLSAEPPTVTVEAAQSKNRKKSVQPLPADVSEALRDYLAGRPSDQAVWPGNWPLDAAEMLRGDLEAAGIPYRDEAGRVADFHALRHSYITLLERAGVSPKVAQELARHSDIRLTMNVYTHARLFDLAGAVEGLPKILPAGPGAEGQALAKTGTDGKACPSACPRIDGTPKEVRLADGTAGSEDTHEVQPNILKSLGLEGACVTMMAPDEKLPGQDSNLDKENQNVLLPHSKALPENKKRGKQEKLSPLLSPTGDGPCGFLTPDLSRVIDLWPELPEALRLALARWPELPEPIRAAMEALAGTAGK